jgi:hypothetical protein
MVFAGQYWSSTHDVKVPVINRCNQRAFGIRHLHLVLEYR